MGMARIQYDVMAAIALGIVLLAPLADGAADSTSEAGTTSEQATAGRVAGRVAAETPARSPERESEIVSALIGSAHDFSQGEPRPRDLCLPCHAPHLPTGAPPVAGVQPPAARPLTTYAGLDVELTGASLLCLSCHDGVVATDVFTSSHATRLSSQLGASQLGYGGLIGHPVGVRYPVGDVKYYPEGALTADGRIELPEGRIQCTSCHDPHNTGRHPGLLVKSNRRSRLCLSCHRL
jgi:predicted CXXCH cytochrome family protein